MDKLQELYNAVAEFCTEREWDQFHNPKDLAIGLSTESNELLDIFRFKDKEDMQALFESSKRKEQIEDELADVFFFLLRFAQMNQIDLEEVLRRKIKKNEEKYPVRLSKGSNKKYNET